MKNSILIIGLCLFVSIQAHAETQTGQQAETAKKAKTEASGENQSGGATETAERIGTYDLLQMLIRAGVLTQEKADEMLQQRAQEMLDKKPAHTEHASDIGIKPNEVRVPYVPKFIKDQIRDQVRVKLREEVVNAVIGQAEQERWGIPDALPEWVNRIKFKGDFRLRYQGDFFPQQNDDVTGPFHYYDFQAVNDAGYFGSDYTFFHNITHDRNRLRSRLRLAMDAKATEGVNIGMRLTTGNLNDPVSTNQTMGNNFRPYSVVLDRAFMRWKTEYDELYFWGGRMPNPWLSSSLVWDSDLNFDGMAFKYYPLRSDDMDDDERIFELSLTAGAYPLKEVSLSPDDKWLYGFQTGLNWTFFNQNRIDIGIAYYDYANITGRRNEQPYSHLLDYTAADQLGSGNTLFNIANNPDNPDETLLARASDYNLLDIVLRYKYAHFAPLNLVLTADYVRNVGYNRKDMLARTQVGDSLGLISTSLRDDAQVQDKGDARVNGYMLRIDFGWPIVKLRGNWNMALAYKYLERDAVLDVFTDSDFRGGGTDVKGWQIEGSYAVANNTWVTTKYISADAIDGPPYGQDTVQVDLNASF